MNLRKVTIRIVLAVVSVIAVGGMIAGCSSEEFEEVGPRKTQAKRKDEINPEIFRYKVAAGNMHHQKNGNYTRLNAVLRWDEGWTQNYQDAFLFERVWADSVKPHPGEIKRLSRCSFENKYWLEPQNNDNRVRISYSAHADTKIYFRDSGGNMDSLIEHIFLDTIQYVNAVETNYLY